MSFTAFVGKCRELEQRELDRDRMRAGDWSQSSPDGMIFGFEQQSGRGRGGRKGKAKSRGGTANSVRGGAADNRGRPKLQLC